MMFPICVVFFVPYGSANLVGVPPARVVARSTSTARGAGYIPDGLTEKEWEAMKKKKAAEAANNKKYFKQKKFEARKYPTCNFRLPSHCRGISI